MPLFFCNTKLALTQNQTEAINNQSKLLAQRQDISAPQWRDGGFNHETDDNSYRLISGPNFDQQNRKVEWIVEVTRNSEIFIIDPRRFQAEFEDSSGILLETVYLTGEGRGNRQRWTLRIPNSVWQRWSEISTVRIVYDY